jgi:uncharacterized membrane protein SpoIIM required for sporulation
LVALDVPGVRRDLRPLRVFVLASIMGLAVGLLLHFLFRPLLVLLQDALFYRITKPLELIQGPLTGILGTEEAVTTVYLLANNLLVSFVAAFGGLLIVKYTTRDEEPYGGQSRATDFLHRLIGEGSEVYKEHSVLAFLLPLAVVFVNGLILGIFSIGQGLTIKELWVYIAYILPHGIIEIPAVILAASIGYYHAVKLDRFLQAGKVGEFYAGAGRLLHSRRSWAFFSIVVVMIVSAAAIESYVTPRFGRNALQKAYFSLEALNASVPAGEEAYLVLRAAFGSNLTFHRDSSGGPEFPVTLLGSEDSPFSVDGSPVPTGEAIISSRLAVPEDSIIFVLEFRVDGQTGPLTIFARARHGQLESTANVSIEA